MKKIISLTVLCVCSLMLHAQLKVTPDGKVGIGITQTPVSKFAVGTTGGAYWSSFFQGEVIAVRVHGSGNPSDLGYYWGTGLEVTQDITYSRGNMGISCSVVRPAAVGYGRAIGLSASAGNATSGYNWGVIGNLGGSNDGTGILGIIGNSQGIPIDGKYAGYFVGNVKVTGVLNGVVVGNSDIRYKDNVEALHSAGKGRTGILQSITSLSPVSYNYKQIYLEAENTADSIKAGSKMSTTGRQALYDEKSPMFRKKHFGLIAQDLQKIYPDLVSENDNGYLAINYIELIPLLIQSIKELKAEVDLLAGGSLKALSASSPGAASNVSGAVLYPHTPTPFTSKTEIKFDLPAHTTNASVYIFDMQGTLLKQIPAGNKQSGITLNERELKAGMYLYTLIVDGNEADTKRMILTN